MSDGEDGATPSKVQKLSSSVTEVSSEADSSIIDMDTQKALEDIDACQNEIDSLNEKASEEILCIEQKYNKLRKPHFEKRNELIKQIPNFWVTTFINHPQMSHLINQIEEKCLQYLTQLEVSEFEDIKSGFSLSFFFNSNPYFSNDVISKSYFLAVKDGRPHSKSSQIRWKSNDLSRAFQSKKVQTRIPGVGPRVGSFFSWFTENGNPLMDKIADLLKDDIWPNPLQYYLAPDIEVEENGRTDDDSDGDNSVVIVGDDDSDDEDSDNELDDDDDEVYEVEDFDDAGDLGEESVELLEVDDDDDDDDDDVEVIESDSDMETSGLLDTSLSMTTSGLPDTSQGDSVVSLDTSKPGKTNDESASNNDKVEANEDNVVTTSDNGGVKDSATSSGETKDLESVSTSDGKAVDEKEGECTTETENKSDGDNKDASESVEDGGTGSVSEVVKDGSRGDTSDGNVVISNKGGGDG